MHFEPLSPADEQGITEMSQLATAILRAYYDLLLGKAQNDYMLQKFQSEAAIRDQLNHGYRYDFVCDGGRKIGFIAYYPREDHMYLSKFYLCRDARGRGYARQMLDHVAAAARREGLGAIELNVNRFNTALLIYQKLGFTIIRAEKNDIGSGYYMDDYVCRLEI